MFRTTALLACSLLLGSCGVTGHYESEGPCKGFRKDQQACQRADQNSRVIGQVKLGQTTSEVRSIMGKDPERRQAQGNVETWWYLTEYATMRYAVITFKDDRVSELR
jgi:hypothetical protein